MQRLMRNKVRPNPRLLPDALSSSLRAAHRAAKPER